MKLIRKLGFKLDKKGNKIYYGEFLCSNTECNKVVERQISNGKKQESCGCNKGEGNKNGVSHGYSYTKLYKVWASVKDRCLNPNIKQYKDYGGRGITICNEWLEFIPFRDWALSNGYQEGLEIDRIDNNGNYEPSNCRFVTREINGQNRRTVKLTIELANEIRVLYKTGDYTQKELGIKYNVIERTISHIINKEIWKNG